MLFFSLMKKKKILFTSVYKPFDTFEDGTPMMDLYAGRLTKGQGIFTFRSHYPALPLFLIAENISIPAVVLENPPLRALRKELEKGYDYLAIHFAASLFYDRVLTICKMAKEISPSIEIILGGYGVVCVSQDFENEKELRSLVDHICHGEGVRFMRELLGDPVDAPIQERFPTTRFSFFGVRIYFDNLLAAVGCRAGCEFCATSAFFQRKKIQLLSPSELVEHLKENVRKNKSAFTWVFDEDFFSERNYVREFASLVAADPECVPGKFSWGGFGSISTLSRYSPEELVCMGVRSLWIGIESKFSDLPKRQGKDVREFFASLHDAGISTIGSFIVGWDFHTSENIVEDIDHVVEVNPTFAQISSLMPCPETKLWDRMKEEGRLRTEGFTWKGFHLYANIHRHLHLPDDSIQHWVLETQNRIFEVNGPSILKSFEVDMLGYRKWKDHPDLKLQTRAIFHGKWCYRTYMALSAVARFGPSEIVRKKARVAILEYRKEFGRPSLLQRIGSLWLVTVAALSFYFPSIFCRSFQPPFSRTVYRGAK
ncbi:MAG: hypothetical protein WC049_08450 [Candidatus Ratteibacteria bacterium]